MEKTWKNLGKAPVVAAVFQLRFDMGQTKLDSFLRFDNIIKRDLPNRTNNIEANINIPNNTGIPLGRSPINGAFSEASLKSYLYYTKDQKIKLNISNGEITYTSELPYEGWDSFKGSVLKYINMFSPILEKLIIKRTSIRFINQFTLQSFDDPSEYFNTLITSTSDDHHLPYPLLKYGFRLNMDISEGIMANVNQNADKFLDRYIYIFDLDVLDHNNLIFDIDSVSYVLENLRKIKNNIFFSNITDKTIQLCS